MHSDDNLQEFEFPIVYVPLGNSTVHYKSQEEGAGRARAGVTASFA